MKTPRSLRVLFLHRLEGEGPIPSRLKAIAACYNIRLLLPTWEGERLKSVRGVDAVLAVATSAAHASEVACGVGMLKAPALFLLAWSVPLETRQEIIPILGSSQAWVGQERSNSVDPWVGEWVGERPPTPKIERSLGGLANILLGLLALRATEEGVSL